MSRLRRAFPWHPTAIAVASTFVLVGALGLAQEPPDAAFLGAVRSGDVAAVAAWLDRDPGALRRADAEGLQPVHFAAFFGQKAVLELLLARGADLRAGGPLRTPLHAAVFGGRTELVRWLAGQGLDPNAAAEEAPPLLVVAVRRGTAEMVEALLGAGAEPGNLGPSVNTATSEYTPALGVKAAAPAPPLAATEVVARCAEAMGGAERVAAVRTLRLRMEIASPARTVTHEVKRPNRIRSESGYVLVFDGRRAGFLKGAPSKDGKDPGPLLLPPEEGRDFEVDVAFLFPAFFDHPAGYAGTETFEGRLVHVVGVTLPLGARMTYLLDAETFLPVRAVAELETAEGPYRTGRTFSDYAPADGLLAPRTVVSEGWAFSGRAAVTKVEVNVPLDDRRFEMP